MTFIQPGKENSILNMVLAALVIALVGGTFWVIVAYNKTVDLSHDITAAKVQLDTLGAENTSLNDNIVALLGGNAPTQMAAADNLVLDKNPQYFPTDQTWPIASQ